MKDPQDLFGLTYDQQLDLTNGEIEGEDITPNRRLVCEIIFEPMRTGVNITVRDATHQPLWGFVACKTMLGMNHCPVGLYERLREMVDEELAKNNRPCRDTQDPI